MRKNFAQSLLLIFTIMLGAAFTTGISARTTVDNLIYGNTRANVLDVLASQVSPITAQTASFTRAKTALTIEPISALMVDSTSVVISQFRLRAVPRRMSSSNYIMSVYAQLT
jgi:hypothetical protein